VWAVPGKFFQALPVILLLLLLAADADLSVNDFLNVSVCLTDGQDRGRAAVRAVRAEQGGRGRAGQARQKDLGNFRIWFSGHGF